MLTGITLLQALEDILHQGRVVLADIADAVLVMELAENFGMEVVLVQGDERWTVVAEDSGTSRDQATR
jgi:hypothetical protein